MSQPTPAPTLVPPPRRGENTWLWLTKIVTGPLLLLILILHFTVNHYLGSMSSGLMTYADVVGYYKHPIIPSIEMFFLVTVVTHSLIGLRGILVDMNPTRRVLDVASWVLGLLGVSSIVYGAWLLLTIASRGA